MFSHDNPCERAYGGGVVSGETQPASAAVPLRPGLLSRTTAVQQQVGDLMRLVKVTVPSALLFSAAASIWCSKADCYSDRNASSSRARLWK